MNKTDIKDTLDFVNEGARGVNKKHITVTENMLSVGQFIPQGDVALQKLSEIPKGSTQVQNPEAKIVPGTTQGSQHIWDSLNGVEVYDPPESMKSKTKGLIYKLTKERTLTHPEHGHHTYHEGFIGFTCFQRTPAGERVRD